MGVPDFVWTESLKCQSPLKQGRKKGFKNRYIHHSIPNLKFHKNKKYWADASEYHVSLVEFELPSLLEDKLNALLPDLSEPYNRKTYNFTIQN
jgi:hypothetical protein